MVGGSFLLVSLWFVVDADSQISQGAGVWGRGYWRWEGSLNPQMCACFTNSRMPSTAAASTAFSRFVFVSLASRSVRSVHTSLLFPGGFRLRRQSQTAGGDETNVRPVLYCQRAVCDWTEADRQTHCTQFGPQGR